MYVKVKDGAVEAFPYGFRELMRDNPNTSFPDRLDDDFLAQYGIHPVTPLEIPQPFDDVTQNVATADPVLVDKGWVQSWSITEASDAEIAQRIGDLAQNARSTRNNLLSETDWAALVDSTLTPEMSKYRQALRDITKQTSFPRLIDWPIKP